MRFTHASTARHPHGTPVVGVLVEERYLTDVLTAPLRALVPA
jgi:hypothetical protein